MKKTIFQWLLLFLLMGFALSNRSILGKKLSLSASSNQPFTPTATCSGGYAGIYPCRNINLLGHVTLGNLGGGGGNDIWGWADPQSGKEYALFGNTQGISFVDVTNPSLPVYLGRLPTQSFASGWRDMKTYGNWLFVVADYVGEHGMQAFDLTHLRGITTPQIFSADYVYSGVASAHNLAINESQPVAYIVGSSNCGGGLHMVDISNPADMRFLGCFSADGYTHDAQCVTYHGPDAAYSGHELCFNSNADTLTIVDVTDKNAPVMIARKTYGGVRYTHQGWLTEDHRYFLMGDENDELVWGHNTRTYIWDVSNLQASFVLGTYTGPTTSVDHNLYTLGDFVYEANYKSGLRVLEMVNMDSAELIEVAYFDVYPANDNTGWQGAWSVYPYLPSGNLLVSSIDDGLFILQSHLDQPSFTLQLESNSVYLCNFLDDANTSIRLNDHNGYANHATLTLQGNPSGITATLASNQLTAGQSTQINIQTNYIAPGTYPLVIHADDGSLHHETILTLVTTNTLCHTNRIFLPAVINQ